MWYRWSKDRLADPTKRWGKEMDYFFSTLEEGSLVMEPICGECKEQLNEDYYCDRCQRQCLCTNIVCQDQETLEVAKKFIQEHPEFHRFRAYIGPRK